MHFFKADLSSMLSLKRQASALPASTLMLSERLIPTLMERHF